MKLNAIITAAKLDRAIDTLQGLIEDMIDVRFDYSGRGMNGRTCYGFILPDNASVTLFVTILAQQLSDDGLDHEVLDWVYDLSRAMRTDSMGKDTIIYWPTLTIEGV